jgi:hypothetical protein
VHTFAVPIDYRKTLAENVARLLRYHGKTAKSVKAIWPDGKKRGNNLGARNVQYVLSLRTGDSPGPSVDFVAGIAHAFKLEPWHLLVPGFNPASPPEALVVEHDRAIFRAIRASRDVHGDGEREEDQAKRAQQDPKHDPDRRDLPQPHRALPAIRTRPPGKKNRTLKTAPAKRHVVKRKPAKL